MIFLTSIKNLQWLWWHGNCEHWITVEADIFQRVWWGLCQLHLCRHQQTWELKHKLHSLWWVQYKLFILQNRELKRCRCRVISAFSSVGRTLNVLIVVYTVFQDGTLFGLLHLKVLWFWVWLLTWLRNNWVILSPAVIGADGSNHE